MKKSMISLLGMILTIYGGCFGIGLCFAYAFRFVFGIENQAFYVLWGFIVALIANLQIKVLTDWKIK